MEEPVDPNAMGWPAPGSPIPAWAPRYPSGAPVLDAPIPPVPAEDGPGHAVARITPPSSPLSVSRPRLVGAGLASGVLVTALVVVVAVIARGNPHSPARPLAMPTSLGGYRQLTNGEADQVTEAIQGGGGSTSTNQAFFAHSVVGVYAQPGSDLPQLVTIAGRTDSTPGIQTNDPAEAAQQLIEGSVTVSEQFSAGTLGGAVECGVAEASAGPESICSWYDTKTVGLILSFNPPLSPSTLDSLDATLRHDLEG